VREPVAPSRVLEGPPVGGHRRPLAVRGRLGPARPGGPAVAGTEPGHGDRGEPGKGNDTMRMQLFAPGPVLVYDSLTDFADQAPASACDGHRLDGGNIQIHSGVKS